MKYGADKIENNSSLEESDASENLRGAPLNLSIVTTEEEFDRLEESWTQLVERSECTVFQTFEWQRTWWQYFLNDGKHELYCLVFRDGDRVVGIAPIYRDRVSVFGLKIVLALEVIAGGYTDIIADDDYKDRVFDALAKHLRSAAGYWDVLRIRPISATSETPRLMIRHFRENGVRLYPMRGVTCPQVSLPGSWEEYLKLIGQNMRHKVKRKTKALSDISDFDVEVIEKPDSDIKRAVGELAEIYGRRRRGLGDESWLDSPQNLKFIADVSGKFARRGWLRLFFLRVDSERVAANLHFHFKHRIYGYLCGVDGPPEIMKYSPGFLLHCSAIREGISEGMGLYDMMFGSQPYKQDAFKGTPIHVWELHAVSPLRSHYYRYLVMQSLEFMKRAMARVGEEYREAKRYRAAHNASFFSVIKFMAMRFGKLLTILRIHTMQIVKGNKMTLDDADRDDL